AGLAGGAALRGGGRRGRRPRGAGPARRRVGGAGAGPEGGEGEAAARGSTSGAAAAARGGGGGGLPQRRGPAGGPGPGRAGRAGGRTPPSGNGSSDKCASRRRTRRSACRREPRQRSESGIPTFLTSDLCPLLPVAQPPPVVLGRGLAEPPVAVLPLQFHRAP